MLKKTFAILLLVAVLSSTAFCGADVIPGDVNGDGKVNMLDFIILSRYIANWPGYSNDDIVYAAGDTNSDGVVNSFDRMYLARHVVKWPGYETLPILK